MRRTAAAAVLLKVVLAFLVAIPASLEGDLLQHSQKLPLAPKQLLTDLFPSNRTAQPPPSMAAALSAALHPHFLNATRFASKAGGPIPPNATRLLDALLADETLAAAAVHWLGNASTWDTALQLIRSGRSAVSSSSSGKGKPASPGWLGWLTGKRTREPALDAAAFSAWLSEAQAAIESLPPGRSMPLLRRAIVALLLRAWVASGGAWSSGTEAAAQQLVQQVCAAQRRGTIPRGAGAAVVPLTSPLHPPRM